MTQNRSITETPNFLSSDIDLATPQELLRILRQADAQIFSGYLRYPGLYDEQNISQLVELAQIAAKTLAKPKGCVVLSGAGTSGRLAMFAARLFNRAAPASISGREPFRYLMAGGDLALIQAQEGAEDSATQSIEDLKQIAQDAQEVFYVGITCGLSAPYIAGQLTHMLAQKSGTSVLLGFNPLELARNTSIEGWQGTFRDAAQHTHLSPNGWILNPIIGPEPITGSTRMKSGSATKILLEVLFHTALGLLSGKLKKSQSRQAVVSMLRSYEEAVRSAYLALPQTAELVQAGGETLRSGGRICYLGAAGYDSNGRYKGGPDAGILGLIDASECPPTFGASFEDVRGYVLGGWKTLFPGAQKDLSDHGVHYRISIEDFLSHRLASLGPKDLCVFLGDFAGKEALFDEVRRRAAKTAAVAWTRASALAADHVVRLDPVSHPMLEDGPLELQIKLVLNALTTGAHVLAGKVYGNRMVDLRLSNNKLFYRTVGIIADLIRVSHDEATDALLRSVYKCDTLAPEHENAPISEHIEASKHVDKVVPKALLLATGKFTYKEASRILKRNPIVRQVIVEHLKG